MNKDPSSDHSLLTLNLPFEVILRWCEVVFWCLEWECCTFQKIDENSFKSSNNMALSEPSQDSNLLVNCSDMHIKSTVMAMFHLLFFLLPSLSLSTNASQILTVKSSFHFVQPANYSRAIESATGFVTMEMRPQRLGIGCRTPQKMVRMTGVYWQHLFVDSSVN